jgi:hypothetical protein
MSPVRCCLRDARPGERLVLANDEPPLPPSPYRERGAVYVHAESCAGPEGLDSCPVDWIGRPQVLRAYDGRGWIHPATSTHDGRDPAASLAAVLAEPGAVQVHSRNIAYGCYMFSALTCARLGAWTSRESPSSAARGSSAGSWWRSCASRVSSR